MLKKVMLYVMMLLTASKLVAMAVSLSSTAEHLPTAIYYACGIVVAFGLFLIGKWIFKTLKKRELVLYYLVAAVSVVFNLVYFKMFSRMEVALLDFLVIGTVMDIVVSVFFILSVTKDRRYVKIPQATVR